MSDLIKRKSVIKVKNYLNNYDKKINLIVLDNTARTAIDAANSLNTKVGSIVKSLLFKDAQNNYHEVPKVLLSGHHEQIKQWRVSKSIEKTKLIRPDLLEKEKKEQE